jgi:hypothetical protein
LFKAGRRRDDKPSTNLAFAAAGDEATATRGGRTDMSTTEQFTDNGFASFDAEPGLELELELREGEALRAWLLKATADGVTSLDDPLVNAALAKLGRAVDSIHATVNVRRELEEVGLNVAHLTDEQVRELGRRVSEAALPGIRG